MSSAIILGIGGTIGFHIAKCLIRDEWRIVGTYRDTCPEDLHLVSPMPNGCCVELIRADLREANPSLITKLSRPWDLLVIATGQLKPIGPFETTDFQQIQEAFQVNLLDPLRLIQSLLPFRNRAASVITFAGDDPNKANPNLFAYHVSKIALIAAMEQLQSEITDCRFTALGPGYVPSKIHNQLDQKPQGLTETPLDGVYSLLRLAMEAWRPAGTNLHIRAGELVLRTVDAGQSHRHGIDQVVHDKAIRAHS